MKPGDFVVFSQEDDQGEEIEIDVLLMAINEDAGKATVGFPTPTGYADVRNFVPTGELSEKETSGEGN